MLLGRNAERGEIDRLLQAARCGRSTALVIVGEPGTGKTALLDDTAARADGMRALRVRGLEAEAPIPFAGLLTLLRPALNGLDRIPALQAAALRGALALGPPVTTDALVIGAATLSLLAAYAEVSPLLVLVDDGHWLDRPSAAAIVFAARRLFADPVAVLLAARTSEGTRIVEEADLPRLALGGLDHEAAAALLGRRSNGGVSPEVAERLIRATAANPLALIELAADAPAMGVELLEGPLPIRTSVENSFARQIEALSPAARRVLLVAAADDSGRLGPIERAARRLGSEARALEEAERRGLVSIALARVEFRHPLVRSAAYHVATPEERRAAHRALADCLEHERDADRRAWHLASAAFGPDEEAAAPLERAARRARARSAYAAAETAFERSARLSPDEDARARRLFAAADAAWLAGHPARTTELVEAALERCRDPRLRAELEHLRGYALLRAGPVMRGHDVLVEAAARIAALDPAKAIVMLAEAADACVYAGRPEAMLATARRAWALLSRGGGEREAALAGLALGTALIYCGQGAAGARLLREAMAGVDGSDALGRDPRVLAWAALGPLWLRENGTGRALIDRAIAAARDQAAAGVLPQVLFVAGRDAATSDRWAVANAHYDEAIRIARETGQAAQLCANLASLACVEARRGREGPCRAAAAEALTLAERLGLPFFESWALSALADLELGLGRLDEASARLEANRRVLDEHGIADADISPIPELAEVQVRAGRAARVVDDVDEYVRRAEEKGQPWALARAERCRGLLAADHEIERHLGRALAQHARTADRFEEARTRLCLGERLRRARRRRAARVELRAAFDAFDALGAAPWAERARVELRATGETARRRDAGALDRLTPQELQVAIVLAQGATTREAAAALFLSPKTIEFHLRNVYRKLGIRSRDALVGALAADAAARPG